MKSFKKLITSVLLITSAISLSGCGMIKNIFSIIFNDDDSEYGEVSRPSPSSYAPVSKTVGASGGTLSDDGNITINIPANALSVDTPITAQYVEDETQVEDCPFPGFLGAVQFGPSGTTFDQPAQVTMRLKDTPRNEKVCIFCYDEEEDIWDFVTEADVLGGNASFTVNHFSYYKALDLTPRMTGKWDALVRTAMAEGYSDSWILDTFVDYLVNQEHVLDYYTEYGGLLYEPCGLHVSGNYFMNGKEGDPNYLITMVGESNQVGNRFGLSRIASETDSYKEFIKEKNKPASERQEITTVLFIIDYKMIKPNIEASADKTILDEGETATVNVYCHYVNPDNFFPEFRDVILPYYPLTLPFKLVHLTTDVDKLTTNSEGRASFRVTSLDGEPEVVKVMFYVEGYFGEYADAYVTFNNGGYSITGHVSETLQFNYNAKIMEGSPTTRETGTFDLKVDYDLDGVFEVKDETKEVVGSITYKNITATLQTTRCHDYYHYDLGGDYSLTINIAYHLFATHSIGQTSDVTFPLSGSYDETNSTVNLNYSGASEILKITGTVTGYGGTGDFVDLEGAGTYNCDAKISGSNTHSFANAPIGTSQEDTLNSFNDNFEFNIDYDFSTDPDGIGPTFPDYGPSLYQTSTSHSYIIERIVPQE